MLDYVKRTKNLPNSPIDLTGPNARGHYVSPEKYATPDITRDKLQIDKAWGDRDSVPPHHADLRFTVDSASLETGGQKCAIPTSASRNTDTLNKAWEPWANDHPIDEIDDLPLTGGAPQLLIEGGTVTKIEIWNGSQWVDVPFLP